MDISYINFLYNVDPAKKIADDITGLFIKFFKENIRQYTLPGVKYHNEFEKWDHKIEYNRVLTVLIEYDIDYRLMFSKYSVDVEMEKYIKDLIKENQLVKRIKKIKSKLEVKLYVSPGKLKLNVFGIDD